MSIPIKIGIIGGSGLEDLLLSSNIANSNEITVTTPYGKPSDVIIECQIDGVQCALLSRHGRKHSIMPTNVNYRANIWALKTINCTHLIVSTATGSLREHIKPGDLIIPDDFIDHTTKRQQTFYDGEENSCKGVCHLPMSPSFCPKTSSILIETAQKLGYTVHPKGTVLTIEGPRFSSKAESLMFRQWGGDLVNMTTCPEVVLAKEAGLMYAAIAIATDYDCWMNDGKTVTVAEVMKTFKENVHKVKQILTAAVGAIGKLDQTDEILQLRRQVDENIMGT